MRSHVYIAPITGGEERHVSNDSLLFAETSAVWTADGKYLVFVSSAGTSTGVASTGARFPNTMQMWALPLRDQDKDPLNRDVDNEAQGVAAEAASRQGGGRGAGGGAAAPPVEVKIDWAGLAERARRLNAPGDVFGGLTATPEGHSVAFTSSTASATGGAPGGGAGGPAIYVMNVESEQASRVPQPAAEPAAGGRGGRGGGGGFGGGGAFAFTRDGRTIYFRAAGGLYAAAVPSGGGAGAAAAPAAAGARGGQRGAGGGTDATPAAGGASARHVTYSVILEVDHKALRKQVFDEGWRIMKNRFYDAAMHGADWTLAKSTYGPLLNYLVDEEELHTVMMMMIGELNASHTGVSGGPADAERSPAQTRHPGFDLVADASGYYRVGHVYKTGPADHDYLKIKEGDFIIALDDRDLKTTDNYWQYFTISAGRKFHFLVNGKPVRDGAWEVTIEPIASAAFGNLQYAKWVDDRREMVNRLSGGEFGYLHIRAMDAASLRQFELDLAANRTKKALIIDQRFNGGGGIDQELLGILAGRKYQVLGRPRLRREGVAPAELLRADGRDAERALGVGRGDVPGGIQGSRSRQDHRCADDGRGDRHRVLHAARRVEHPDAGQRRLDGQGREPRELRRAAGRLRRQLAGRLPGRTRPANREGRGGAQGRTRGPRKSSAWPLAAICRLATDG